MATRMRDGIPGKEKNSPQQANPAQRRGSTNPSPSPSRPIGAKSASPGAKSASPGTKSASPSSDKSATSSSRPTRSRLSIDNPTQPAAAKKPAAAAAAAPGKPSFARLRSLDKNPAPVSPSPRTRQSSDPKEKIMRPSSSFSGSRSTGTTLQKGASNRIVKTAAKKSNNVTTKKTGGSSASSASSANASRSPSIISSPERVEDPEIVNVPHPQEDDPQSSVSDEEVSSNALSSHVKDEQVPIDASSNHEMPSDIGKEEKQQTDPPVQAKPEIHEQKDINIVKSLTSEGSMKTEAEDQNAPGKETSSFHLESQQQQEQLKDNSTDPVNENLEVQAEDQGNEEVKDATEAMEKKEDVKEEDQVVKMKETEKVKNIASPEQEPQSEPGPGPGPGPGPEQEQKPEPESEPALAQQKSEPESEPALAPTAAPEETQTAAGKRSVIVQGKKDAAVVSNDAIEETASKLQEQRKNRVRALAGAFESVMK